MADPIPNIRFNVAKSLEVIAQTLGKLPEGPDVSQQRIVPAVESLKNDSDADVRYFANRALQQALQAASAGEFFAPRFDPSDVCRASGLTEPTLAICRSPILEAAAAIEITRQVEVTVFFSSFSCTCAHFSFLARNELLLGQTKNSYIMFSNTLFLAHPRSPIYRSATAASILYLLSICLVSACSSLWAI
jgi:hypothetical protein